jgi:aerotaxis receptor
MKINLPITQHERLFAADKTLVSKTDTQGFITFANKDFIEISGFSEVELMGANHNLIRHPDMPAKAFEIMWQTLEQGLTWHGLVKNRCKNGDFYWVDAKVVPIKKRGQIIGYMSVRTCPSRAAVASAQAAYQRAATAPETIQQAAAAGWKKHLSIKNGIPVWIAVVTLMMIIGGLLGITGLSQSNTALQNLYAQETVPLQTIGRINFLMADNRAQVALTLHHDPLTHATTSFDHTLNSHLQALLKNKEEIDRLWTSYGAQISSEPENRLAQAYWDARNKYVQDGLLKARLALEAGDFAQTEQLLLTQVSPLYEQANVRVSALLKHLSERGRTRFTEVTQRNQLIITTAIIGIALCCLALIVAGIFFFRLTVLPLHKAVLALEDIADGKLSGEVDSGGYGEPGRVMAAVKFMQTHLKVMLHEIRQSSDSIHQQCHHLNQTMMNLAQNSEEQHDRVYQTLDVSTEASDGLRTMAADAESLMRIAEGGSAPLPQDAAPDAAQASGLEPMPPELLALFDEQPDQTPMGAKTVHEDTTEAAPTSADEESRQAGAPPNLHRMQAVAGAARVQSAAVDDVARQLNQIASLIVQNREDVQGAWAATQKLEKTAGELEALVKYFE